jgi:hypothetical protein
MAVLDHRDTVTDFEMPAGTFFDIGVVHLLTTATLDPLRALYPQGVLRPGGFASISWSRSRDKWRTTGLAAP